MKLKIDLGKKSKTIYSVFWYLFLGCSFVWLICGLGYNFFYNDKVEQSRVELTQALNTYFPREQYLNASEVHESNRRNLLSKGVAIEIRKDSLHKDIKSIKPISGNWTLVDQAKIRYVYENESYRVYVSENPINDGYTVVLARNNWLELLHL